MEAIKKFYIISCHVLWREIFHFASVSKNIFNVKFLKQGLHNTPDLLRTKLQQSIDVAEDDYNAILLGFGLCSNSIQGITAKKTKLVLIRAHDCITFLLGSRKKYKEYFDSHPGTYWYSPGWIDGCSQPSRERYEKTLKQYEKKYGKGNAEFLMEAEQGWFKNYSNAAYVDLGFIDNKNYKEYTKECAKWLNWNYDELSGNPTLLIKFLEGDWDDDFLVVNPGETVVATHDEKILGVKT